MNNILKVFATCFLCLHISYSYAQTLGIRAGFNLSYQRDKNNYANATNSFDKQLLPGANIGLVFNFPPSKEFSFETGLYLLTKGQVKTQDDYTEKNYLLYLQIPANIKYSYEFGGIKCYSYVGPYFAYGIFGEQLTTNAISGVTENKTEVINFGRNTASDVFLPYDVGLQAGTGIMLGSFIFQIEYGFGLNDISHFDKIGTSVRNRVLSFTLGFNFDKNNKKLFSEFEDL